MSERTQTRRDASVKDGAKSRRPMNPDGKSRSSHDPVKKGALAVVSRPLDEPLDLDVNAGPAFVNRVGLRPMSAREVVVGFARDAASMRRLAATWGAARRLERPKIERTKEDKLRLSQLAAARTFWMATRAFAEYWKGLLPTPRQWEALEMIAYVRSAIPKALELLGEPILTSVRGGETIVRLAGELDVEVEANEVANKIIEMAAAAVQCCSDLKSRIKDARWSEGSANSPPPRSRRL